MRRGGGGLVSGMVSALSEVGGLWVCAALSDRERVAARRAPDGHLAEAGLDTGGLDVRMLPLDPLTFGRAYNGIANSTIWFVNHQLYDSANKPVFDAGWRRLWAAYERYNGAFADALAAEAAPGAKVMIQDYHLDVCPRQLRERRDDLRIAHFTHTPWAPPDYFAMLPDPVARELLTGLLGADHVGFHCARWARAFLDCCAEFLGAAVDHAARTVEWEGRTVRIGLHPAGHLRARRCGTGPPRRTSSPRSAHLRDLVGDRQVIARVDRTELSKNIVRGLLAYRELLRHPAGVARAGRAHRVRVPVPARPARVPRVHRDGAAGRPGDRGGVRHRRLGPAAARGDATTIPARWPRCGWPTCCWSTRSGTG